MADSASPLRIPFEVAIAEPRLLKPRFDELSKGQQTALKVAYGVKLTDTKDEKGWSELDYWAAFQGCAEYDKLGAITRILPGVPAPREGEWPEAWAIAGVRSGKALALNTLLPTPEGWTTMGAVQPGDLLLDRTALPTKVSWVSDVQHDRPCYAVAFNDGAFIAADAAHLWTVCSPGGDEVTLTTEALQEGEWAVQGPGALCRRITSVVPMDSVPVRCLLVEAEDHLFLAGPTGIPTHNSDTFASTVLAYEATCGGHEHWLRRGKRAICFLIAQDLRFARWSLPGILATLESMPFISGAKGARQIERVTADQIDLKNGISIAVVPPTVKAVRGFDAPVAVMDEVGIWSLTTDSANPDFEVYRQIKSRQAQFSDGKIVAISSPWVKQGMLWEAYKAGTEGRSLQCEVCGEINGSCPTCVKMREPHTNRLVLHATTASLGNPLVKEEWLRDTERQDPRAFARECLAQFVDALSGFLDPSLLEKAVDDGVRERAPSPRASYVASMDPAFRRDAFGFSIAHVDKERGIVIDVLRRWPAPGERRTTPLNPQDILGEIATLLRQYKIGEVVSDQYHIDTLQQLAINLGFSIRQVTFTGDSKATIYANLQQLLNQKRLVLLDHPETLRELKVIEKRNMPGGGVKIGSPRGDHDDMATVVALAAHQAVWMLPSVEAKRPPEETVFQKIDKQIASKRRSVATSREWAW